MRCSSGVDEPDSGVVRKRNATVGYLPQTPELDESLKAIDAILHSGSMLAQCVLEYEKAIVSGDKKVVSRPKNASPLMPLMLRSWSSLRNVLH